MHGIYSHSWDSNKGSLNRGGLLIEVKMHGIYSHSWDSKKGSLNRGGLLIQVVVTSKGYEIQSLILMCQRFHCLGLTQLAV